MTLREQLKNITPLLIIILAATLVVLSIVILAGLQYNIQLNHFTKDPVQIMNAPFYTGLFSNVGILLWCGSVVICFFVRPFIPKNEENKPARIFLFFSGLVTMLLMTDDLFLLHEEVFPKYLGIPEKGVFVIYSNILLLYALLFRETIFKTDFIILGLAFLLIGGSTFVKRIPMPIPEDTFLEDAVKLFGIICWFTYFLRLGFRELQRTVGEKKPPHF
ncbi:MAG TPA: hypothetical protein VJY62_14765 [Bacteroidia bacterium]|nr:hypothetical protein [Bacteroidia bacterium]